ncbi:MAG: YybH family protein [Candidatus Acidiferrales bacterium]
MSKQTVVPLLLLTVLLGLFLIRDALSTGQGSPSEEASHAAILKILDEQQNAWNRGNVISFMRGYWNSPELTFAGSGGIARGWESVLARYKREYPDQAAMGQVNFADVEVRFLGPDAALVLGQWHLHRGSGDIGGVFSLVFQRLPEGWRIVHDHTSLVKVKAE